MARRTRKSEKVVVEELLEVRTVTKGAADLGNLTIGWRAG